MPWPMGGSGTVRLPQMRGHLAPRDEAVTGDVVDAGEVLVEHVQHGPDDVVLVDELEAGVEAEDRRDDRRFEHLRQRGDDLGTEHVGEAQHRHRDVRVVDREVADVGLDLGQRALDAVPGRRLPGVSSVNHTGSRGWLPYT